MPFPAIAAIIDAALEAPRARCAAARDARGHPGTWTRGRARMLRPDCRRRASKRAVQEAIIDVTNLLAFLFVLGVLVFVHELGHFLLARWHGVRVLTFSLGFGPKLLKVTRGDTEYCISAHPARRLREDGRRERPRTTRRRAPDEFLSKIEVAAVPDPASPGRLMNLAARRSCCMAVVYLSRRQRARLPRRSPAGRRRGRRVVGGEGRHPGRRSDDARRRHDTPTWADYEKAICSPPAARSRSILVRQGARRRRSTSRPTPTESSTPATSACCPSVHPSVPALDPGEPADKAGLKPAT